MLTENKSNIIQKQFAYKVKTKAFQAIVFRNNYGVKQINKNPS